MIEFIIGLLTGLMVGVVFGIATMCILIVGNDKEE